jgi:hypothetical protein
MCLSLFYKDNKLLAQFRQDRNIKYEITVVNKHEIRGKKWTLVLRDENSYRKCFRSSYGSHQTA